MANVLVEFIADNQPGLGISAVAVKEAKDVSDAYALIAAKLGGAERVTKALTKRRTGAKRAFVDTLVAVLGPTRSHAVATEDADLLALATISSTTLRRLRPQALAAVGQKLLTTIDGHVADLAAYGVDTPTHTLLHDTYEAFVAGIPQTRQLINARSVDNMTAQELLKALMQQIYELDEAMKIFAVRDKDLFAGYQKARMIVDVGTRPKDDGLAVG